MGGNGAVPYLCVQPSCGIHDNRLQCSMSQKTGQEVSKVMQSINNPPVIQRCYIILTQQCGNFHMEICEIRLFETKPVWTEVEHIQRALCFCALNAYSSIQLGCTMDRPLNEKDCTAQY